MSSLTQKGKPSDHGLVSTANTSSQISASPATTAAQGTNSLITTISLRSTAPIILLSL
jgi:hypothetical protein